MKKSVLFVLFALVSLVLYGQETPVVLNTPGGQVHGSLLQPMHSSAKVLVVMVAGSGPTDRNGNQAMMQNNSLKLLAQALADKGIASLRYDKRGVGASASTIKDESSLRFEDYVSDVAGWVALMGEGGKFKHIVVLGHSEGSLIGMLACQKSPKVHAFVSLAGPGTSAGDLIREQMKPQPPVVRDMVLPLLQRLEKGDTIGQVNPMLFALFRPSVQPYMISWMKYNPVTEIKKLKIPVMVVQGAMDMQVSTHHADLLKEALPSAQLVMIPQMNHVLKDCASLQMSDQMPIYTDPQLPVNTQLVDELVRFCNSLR